MPTYSPGLPMLMGGMKLVSGQCGLFAVTPLLAGLAVLATYGLGRRLGSPPTGLAGAWFLATSPIVAGTMEPLTDVPVMSAWSIAFYFLLGQGARSAAAAGLFAALAIFIRPNLFPLAAPMAAWFLVRRAPPVRRPETAGLRARVICAGLFSAVRPARGRGGRARQSAPVWIGHDFGIWPLRRSVRAWRAWSRTSNGISRGSLKRKRRLRSSAWARWCFRCGGSGRAWPTAGSSP